MNLTFAAVLLNVLGPDYAMIIANKLRPAERYLFAKLLPEIGKGSFFVSGGSITIRPTMAGLVAMDSPFPPGGHIEVSNFLEKTGKIAQETTLTEEVLRELHQLLADIQLGGGDTTEVLVQTLLNFAQKVVVQPHLDTFEWLRAQALLFGMINWQFGNVELSVNYNFPAGHLRDTKTGNDGFAGSTSKFWEEDKAAKRQLRNRSGILRVMHSDTFDAILHNPVNNFEVTAENGQERSVRRLVLRGGLLAPSSDASESFTVTLYDEEGELLNPKDTSKTTRVPFCTPGRILYTAPTSTDAFRIGAGATDDAEDQRTLGYTHIAPTIEGMNQGQRGGSRWAEVYTPQREPMMVKGRGVTNGLPVIENADRVVVTSTVLP